jgi:hypothetical protein
MAGTDNNIGRVEILPARMGWKPRRERSAMVDAGTEIDADNTAADVKDGNDSTARQG